MRKPFDHIVGVNYTVNNLSITDHRRTPGDLARLEASADATRNHGEKGRVAIEVSKFTDPETMHMISLDRGQAEALSTWLIGWLHRRTA